MNKRILALALFFTGVTAAISAEEINPRQVNQIVQFPLFTDIVRKIYVRKDGVTIVQFPSEISGIYGKGVSKVKVTDAKGRPTHDFMLGYEDKSYYFTLMALKDNAMGSLNIVYNRKTYIFQLEYKKEISYASVVMFESNQYFADTNSPPLVTNDEFLSMFKVVKNYELYTKYHPDALKNILYYRANTLCQYKKFNVLLSEVFRFNKEDTLVFLLVLENKTEEKLFYDPFGLVAQVRDKKYYQSFAQATGEIPPLSKTLVMFAITGTQEGGRNNLRPDNDFQIHITTRDMYINPVTPLAGQENVKSTDIYQTAKTQALAQEKKK